MLTNEAAQDAGLGRIAGVIVTYASRDDLCIPAARGALAAGCDLLIIVAQGVSKKSLQHLSEYQLRDNRVVLEVCTQNMGSATGFAKGIAAAIREGADYLWLLDDDNLANSDTLSLLVDAYKKICLLRGKQGVAVCSARASNPRHERVRTGDVVHSVYPSAGSFMYFDVFAILGRAFRSRMPRRIPSSRVVEVPYGPYGGLFFSKAVIDVVGYPREELVLYEDDTDFTSRLVAAGWPVFMAVDSVLSDAEPKWSETTRQKGPARFLRADSRVRCYYSIRNRVHFDSRQAVLHQRTGRYRINKWVYLTIMVLTAVRLGRPEALMRCWGAARDGERGALGEGPPLSDYAAIESRVKLVTSGVSLLRADFNAGIAGKKLDTAPSRATALMSARFVSVALFRIAQSLGRRNVFLGSCVKQLNQFVTGADLAWQAEVGPGLVLYHPQGVVLGPYCIIGANCTIQQGVTVGGSGAAEENPGLSPVLGDRVRIGAGARIFGDLRVGSDSTIGANAVVTKSVPESAVAVGVPARLMQE